MRNMEVYTKGLKDLIPSPGSPRHVKSFSSSPDCDTMKERAYSIVIQI